MSKIHTQFDENGQSIYDAFFDRFLVVSGVRMEPKWDENDPEWDMLTKML